MEMIESILALSASVVVFRNSAMYCELTRLAALRVHSSLV